MLPSTFDNDAYLRVSELFVGVFAAAVLAAAFSLTGLLVISIRNDLFQAEHVYVPSLTSCLVALLTICYDFLISRRYSWNTASKVTIVVASVSTVIYGVLLAWTKRRIRTITRQSDPTTQSELLRPSTSSNNRSDQWGEQNYYQNYVQNMFPASLNHSAEQRTYTDEELQRQQMLMLLQPNEQTAARDASKSTFRIEWQGQDQEDEAPAREYYAPRSNVNETRPAFAVAGSLDQNLRPWDGVWREPLRSNAASSDSRLAPNE